MMQVQCNGVQEGDERDDDCPRNVADRVARDVVQRNGTR